MASTTATYERGAGAEPDRLRLARERALAAYRRDRDSAALDRTTEELDAEQEAIAVRRQPALAPEQRHEDPFTDAVRDRAGGDGGTGIWGGLRGSNA